jgi:formate hydrogenlyase subunit 3/multisubunit Na+/H+ antiporter MnhD subunit
MRDEIKLLGVGLMFAIFIVMAHTFWTAYNHPSKAVKIYIDKFGEADFELVMIITIGVISILTIIFELQDYQQKQLKRRLYSDLNE